MTDLKRICGADLQEGFTLLGAMVLVLILSLLGVTLLSLAGQEGTSASAEKEAAVAQQLADAAGELVVGWFHSPKETPPAVAAVLAKKNRTAEGGLSFFDQNGRSQFVGTVSQPDFRLDRINDSDDRMLNDPDVGLFRTIRQLGTIEELTIYAPSNPGLLCTVDATVSTQSNAPFRQSVSMQLGALALPPLRSAVQAGQTIGQRQPGNEAPINAHWGDLTVGGDLILGRVEEIPKKTLLAPVAGQGYDEMIQREDRWMNAWIGGQVQVMQSSAGQNGAPSVPDNVYQQQNPIPGIRFDQWPYEQLKRAAKLHGSYFAIDQAGLLYPHGKVEPGSGISPDEVFRSQQPGDHRGLIFIDTLDQTPPHSDNLGTLKLRTAYLEGHVVMQGHVQLTPEGSGRTIAVLSPPSAQPGGEAARTSVQLTGVQFNGVLYASGNITVAGKIRLYGAVVAGGTITPASSGQTLEVWYDHDLGQGLYRGLPVVYRAPGTWLARY